MAKKIKFVARHILEVRKEKRLFNFLDFKGELVDFLVENTDFPNVGVNNNGVRVEVASEDTSEVYFASFENFGFQLDAVSDFNKFKNSSSKILTILDNFKKYKVEKILRLGTKSTILCHIPGRAENGIKEMFFNEMFANKTNFESKTKLKASDIGFLFLDANNKDFKSHINLGPVNRNEAINKFFGKHKLYEEINVKTGILLDIDIYSENLGAIPGERLKEKINEQIDFVESTFTNFISIFKEKKK